MFQHSFQLVLAGLLKVCYHLSHPTHRDVLVNRKHYDKLLVGGIYCFTYYPDNAVHDHLRCCQLPFVLTRLASGEANSVEAMQLLMNKACRSEHASMEVWVLDLYKTLTTKELAFPSITRL